MKQIDRDTYFNTLQNCTTIDELGPEPDDFEMWCFWKYTETKLKTNIKNKNNDLSVEELRLRCCDYGSDVSWSISMYYIIENRINNITKKRKHWYNKKHVYTMNKMKQQGNSAPSNKSIEAYIEYHFTSQWNYWDKKLSDLELKRKSLDDHKKLWMKLDKTYSSMIYDVNSEWYKVTRDIEQKSNKSAWGSQNLQTPISRKLQQSNVKEHYHEFLKQSGV